jgi:hypothetical protein
MSQLCLFDVALISEAGSQAPDVDSRAVFSKPTTTTLLGPTGLSQQFQVEARHNFTSKYQQPNLCVCCIFITFRRYRNESEEDCDKTSGIIGTAL